MRRYVVRRLLGALGVVLFAATLTFVLLHLAPGDPFSASLENPNVTAAVRAQWRASYGLDRPLPEQYGRWIANVGRGELGYSFSRREPVRAVLARALPNTLLLMGLALTLSFALGIAIGAWQAARAGSAGDRTVGAVTLLFFSLPDFWLALMAMLTLAYWWPVFPVTGAVDAVMHESLPFWGRVGDRAHHLVLPVLVLTLLVTGGVARLQRAAMRDALGEEFVRAARARGVSERAIVLRHALRNALLPVITLAGLALPALLGGAVFVEKIFAWPGMGALVVDAVATRDYPLVLAVVVVGSATVAAGSLLADLANAAADPRLRARLRD